MLSEEGQTAISVEAIGKEYALGGESVQYDSFREMILQLIIAPIKRFQFLARKSDAPKFWALKNISFSVNTGEVVGIIGKNGAGKSTLLKVLSRITSPSEGELVYRGRVASLLEVGTGFHPEFSGRENIYLNGSILGMSRQEVNERIDDIVEFSGVEQFLETPVKRYSSGMYVRLAFAVAAHMDPDILIVDEVLAVGDAEFQNKCLKKLGDVSRGGRTVIFVSHNMNSIRRLCSRVICLQDGEIVNDGDPDHVISEYIKQSRIDTTEWIESADSENDRELLKKVTIANGKGDITNIIDYDDTAKIAIEFLMPDNPDYIIAARISDLTGNTLFTSWDTDFSTRDAHVPGEACRLVCNINSHLLRPGDYALTIFIRTHSLFVVEFLETVNLSLVISDKNCPVPVGRLGLIAPRFKWEVGSC